MEMSFFPDQRVCVGALVECFLQKKNMSVMLKVVTYNHTVGLKMCMLVLAIELRCTHHAASVGFFELHSCLNSLAGRAPATYPLPEKGLSH